MRCCPAVFVSLLLLDHLFVPAARADRGELADVPERDRPIVEFGSTPRPRPTLPYHPPFPLPSAYPTPPASPPPSGGGSGSGSGSGSNVGAAAVGAVIGSILNGMSGVGGVPGTGPIGGSGPTHPNAGGIEEGSETAIKFNPDQNKEIMDGDEKEREKEDDACQLECPAEDPGMKGNPNENIVDSNTHVIAYQAPGMSSQGAIDIANAAGASYQVYTSSSAFLGAVTTASAGTQPTAIFINSHGSTNGGLQGGMGSEDIANAWAQGGGNNKNATIIHNECYAGAHASEIAESLDSKGFSQEQRPKQLYSRPAVCQTPRGSVPLNGEQLHQNGYGLTDQALLQATQQGGGVLTGAAAVQALQGMSSPGYIHMIQRAAPGVRRRVK